MLSVQFIARYHIAECQYHTSAHSLYKVSVTYLYLERLTLIREHGLDSSRESSNNALGIGGGEVRDRAVLAAGVRVRVRARGHVFMLQLPLRQLRVNAQDVHGQEHARSARDPAALPRVCLLEAGSVLVDGDALGARSQEHQVSHSTV